jgi:hypothetical protein
MSSSIDVDQRQQEKAQKMVEFLEGNVLSKYLLDKYSKNPNGWSFTLFPPAKEDNGYFGAYVGGPDETWQLKLDSIFKPNPLMLGAKADVDPSKIENLGIIPYGYRRLDRKVAFELLKTLSEGSNNDKDDVNNRFLLDRVLRTLKPVAPVQGESYAEGPFVLTDRSNLMITSSQKQLEDRLSMELRKMIRNRYVSYG